LAYLLVIWKVMNKQPRMLKKLLLKQKPVVLQLHLR
jgi:hypothetical protein